MFEETNQTPVQEAEGTMQETTEEMPASLFDDEADAAETTLSEVEESEQREDAEEAAADAPAVAETPQTVTVKYNGEEKEISLEEAVQLAQKGMNYDHVKQELDGYRAKSQSEADVLDSYARMSGLTRDAYIAMLGEKAKDYAQRKAMDEVQKNYPDADEEVLEELATLRAKTAEYERRETEETERRAEMDRRTKPWREFMQQFPGVDAANLPESVVHDIEGGMHPIMAYQKMRIAELEQEKKVYEQNGFNRAHALGSAKSDAGEEEKDPFLAGFLN